MVSGPSSIPPLQGMIPGQPEPIRQSPPQSPPPPANTGVQPPPPASTESVAVRQSNGVDNVTISRAAVNAAQTQPTGGQFQTNQSAVVSGPPSGPGGPAPNNAAPSNPPTQGTPPASGGQTPQPTGNSPGGPSNAFAQPGGPNAFQFSPPQPGGAPVRGQTVDLLS